MKFGTITVLNLVPTFMEREGSDKTKFPFSTYWNCKKLIASSPREIKIEQALFFLCDPKLLR